MKRFNIYIKHLLDKVFALIFITLSLPIMIILAVVIKLDGGKVLFNHPRIGKNGKIFKCYKFRTMVHHAEEKLKEYLDSNTSAAQEWKLKHKLTNDPRVNKLGTFLRKTSLDELPQLFNVLKGDMSFVGPRPITEAEKSRYRDAIKYYLSVRPGITGMWQISGRSSTSYAYRVFLDKWYVTHWSLCLDMWILLRTIPVILLMRGAI